MEVDPPNLNTDFIDELGTQNISRRSFLKWDRVIHSHGHTYQELFALKYAKLQRVVDCVLYPYTTEQVENLVKLANKHNVVLVPYGGGTNVT